MCQHLSWQLLGTGTSGEHPAPVVLKSTAKRDAGERVLVLRHFGGWYRQLVDLGWGIVGPAAQGAAVQVIALPIGLVGRFQFSATTGRWYTGPDDVHMLGH